MKRQAKQQIKSNKKESKLTKADNQQSNTAKSSEANVEVDKCC